MSLYFVSIGLAVTANIFYHLCMRLTNAQINPMVSLTVTYAIAMVTSLALSPLLPGEINGRAFLSAGWPAVILGVALCGLELGFLLAYRAGWVLSTAALYCNLMVGILLLPIGLFYFRETVTPANWLGIVLAIAALVLIGAK